MTVEPVTVHQQINLCSHHLKRNPQQGEILYDKEKASSVQIQAWMDSIVLEHGELLPY